MADQGRRWVSEISPPERVDQVYLISQPQLRTTTKGDFYIAAFLSDRTGKINGRMWQASEALFNSLPQEGFVRVRGNAELYQNTPQLVINSMAPVEVAEVELEEFLPRTKKNVDEMFARVGAILGDVKNEHLQGLAQAFLWDNRLMDSFKKSPAAVVLHHAYLGGLLEHTLSLMELGVRMLPNYPELDADLVMMGLFLHDMGKTKELTCDISFRYSDQGQMVGHIVQGIMMIEAKIQKHEQANQKTFPKNLKNSLLHIIASHHGTREFGSPTVPATPEAFAVHHMDNLDSKIALALANIEKDNGPGRWTPYVRAIETPLFKIRPDQ
jgi:3'-5' exoribonuclease